MGAYADLYGKSASADCPENDVEINFSQELWPVHCVQGTWGQQLDDRVYIPSNAVTVKKGETTVVDSYGAFENNFIFKSQKRRNSSELDIFSENSLGKLLKLAGVENVYLTGLALDYCVKHTALQAVDRYFNTLLIEDATMPVIEEQGVEAIQEMMTAGVQITKACEVSKQPPLV